MKTVSDLHQEKHSPSQGAEPTDGMLLQQSLAGDQDAFEALVSRYRSPLLNSIRRLLKDDEQADDVLQFVLLRLYDSQPTLLKDVSLRGWLFQVAHHRCLDELRKQRRKPAIHFSELCWEDDNEGIALLESIQDPQPSPEEIVEQRDLRAVLHQAVQSLPPRLRWVVQLHCFRHLTFSEIGRTLKMPVPTAKAYYYRALPLLRCALANNTAVSLSA